MDITQRIFLAIGVAGFVSGVVYFSTIHRAEFHSVAQAQSRVETNDANNPIGPTRDFKLAVIGDPGVVEESAAVMELAREYGADVALILGDLTYIDENPSMPVYFRDFVDNHLGRDIPAIAVIGNHDYEQWYEAGDGQPESGYKYRLLERIERFNQEYADGNPIECYGDFGVNGYCDVFGVRFIMSGVGVMEKRDQQAIARQTQYVRDVLQQTSDQGYIWPFCTWHTAQSYMQLGDKREVLVGWDIYETCREYGALINTAHHHGYQRTKTLQSTEFYQTAEKWPYSDSILIEPGLTRVSVNGMGGYKFHDQARCNLSDSECTSRSFCTTGCDIWDSSYHAEVKFTDQQKYKYGFELMEFKEGEPRMVRSRYINIREEVIDEYTIVSQNAVQKTCGVEIYEDPKLSSNEVQVALYGLSDSIEEFSDTARLFAKRVDNQPIASVPSGWERLDSENGTQYKLAECASSDGNPCREERTFSLPDGKYQFYCDVPTQPTKCSGYPLCEMNGGSLACDGWNRCSDSQMREVLVPRGIQDLECTSILSLPASERAMYFVQRANIDRMDGVSILDYSMLISNFGVETSGDIYNSADINCSQKVDVFDYATLINNFGRN